MPYPTYLDYIQTNEKITTAVANRTAAQLDKRTDSLKEQLGLTEAGHAHILNNLPMRSDTAAGTPVYWNPENCQFEPAYAAAEVDYTRNEYVLSKEAFCIGLVYKKETNTSGSIILSGIAAVSGVSTLLGDTESGRFYLGADAGTLTRNALNVTISLGYVIGALGPCDDRMLVYVCPEHPKTLDHTHISVTLSIIQDDTQTIAGWHTKTAEDTTAPAEAILVYNLDKDTSAKNLFPPIPLSAVSAIIEWADTTTPTCVGGKDIVVNGSDSFINVTNNGIYWMRSTPDVTTDVARITLYYSRTLYDTRQATVTSLQPFHEHPLQFVDCSGVERNTGDLYAKLTLANNKIDSTNYDGTAMREYNEDWVYEQVPVVNGIYSNSDQVSLTGSRTFVYNGRTAYAGPVGVNIEPFLANTELSPQILRLGNALEREYRGIQFVGLPANRASSVIGKIEIPANYNTLGTIKFKLRLLLLAQIAGTFPTLTVTHSVITRPGTNAINVSSLEESSLTCNTVQEVTAGSVFEVESSEIVVTAGSTVLITIARAGDNTYTTDAGIIRFNGIINIE